MRTIPVFIICTILLSVSCKKSEAVAPLPLVATPQLQTTCEDNPIMLLLDALPNQAAVAEWLTENGSRICDEDLYLCIEKRHEITKEQYDKAVGDHPDNNPSIKDYPMSWGEILSFINNSNISCYEKYIGFSFADSRISLKTLQFTNAESCYSVPLFKGIVQKNNLTSSDDLVFTKGRMPIPNSKPAATKEVILIRCNSNSGTSYYDLTDDPR